MDDGRAALPGEPAPASGTGIGVQADADGVTVLRAPTRRRALAWETIKPAVSQAVLSGLLALTATWMARTWSAVPPARWGFIVGLAFGLATWVYGLLDWRQNSGVVGEIGLRGGWLTWRKQTLWRRTEVRWPAASVTGVAVANVSQGTPALWIRRRGGLPLLAFAGCPPEQIDHAARALLGALQHARPGHVPEDDTVVRPEARRPRIVVLAHVGVVAAGLAYLGGLVPIAAQSLRDVERSLAEGRDEGAPRVRTWESLWNQHGPEIQRLTAGRPAAVRPVRVDAPGVEPPASPMVYASESDYPDERLLHLSFMNLPLQRAFRSYSFEDAKRRELDFADSLGRQAGALGLDGTRLRKIYDFVRSDARNGNVQLLPIYAEHARYRGERVWIIVLAWEETRHAEGGVGHVRVFAVSADHDVVRYFTTCN